MTDSNPMSPDQIAALPYRKCVGVMLVNADGDVFVGRRIDTTGAWQMPQGGIDPGETPQVAALRELEEETGVSPDLVTIEAETDDWFPYDLPHHLVPKLWKGRYRGQEQKWVLMRFHGQDQDVNIATQHAEFDRWRWLPADALVDHIVPFKRAVYANVLKAFGGHL